MEQTIRNRNGFKFGTGVESSPKLQTNLDTNFLKLIAIIAMTIDHVGKALMPEVIAFQIIGRLAFPIFAYCIVVGVVHTSNFKNYLLRLGLFAFLSQIPWLLANNSSLDKVLENFMNLNIFFTLFFSAILVYGMKEKSKISLLVAIVAFSMLPLDYGFDTVLLLASMYLLRNNMKLSFVISLIILGSKFIAGSDISIFGLGLDIQGFAILALPLIYKSTNINVKINKFFFYSFYPLHLLAIAMVKFLIA